MHKQRIKEHFFRNPTARLRVRHIERELNVPLPSAIRYAKELEAEGILKSLIIGNIRFYTASRTERYLFHKRLHNLEQLHESGLLDHIKERLGSPTVVLFGSYSRGEDIETSDIDLYIETAGSIDLTRFHRTLGRNVQVHAYRSLKDVQKELARNIVNGITLAGFLEI